MKRLFSTGLFLSMLLAFSVTVATAQINDPVKAFKGYINDMVEKVEHAETPKVKRTIMNDTFDELLATFDKVKEMRKLTGSDKKALKKLTKSITAKKNELNGLAGYKKVPSNQLNEFANFVQQDLEQADTITISVVVALLIVLILLLL